MTRIQPVILCGGAGTRLWPLSRSDRPKQFLDLTEGGSMFQKTLERVADRARFAPPIMVSGGQHLEAIEAQCGEAPAAVILEPVRRNTAPAIALAAHWLAGHDREAVMLVMPSDHHIAINDAFLDAVERGAVAAQAGRLVTFGIRPDAPETGYGYLEMEATEVVHGVKGLRQFVEKPDRATAERYLANPNFAWNAGIFMFRAGDFLDELASFAPAIGEATARALANATVNGNRIMPDAASFAGSPDISVDYAVMEHTRRGAVVPVAMGWSDVGSWDAVARIGSGDADGNKLKGSAQIFDCSGTLAFGADGMLVTALGVSDLVIIATRDSVLVMPRDRAQDVKKVVAALKDTAPQLL